MYSCKTKTSSINMLGVFFIQKTLNMILNNYCPNWKSNEMSVTTITTATIAKNIFQNE